MGAAPVTNEAPPCVWRENKGAPFVEMRFDPCCFLQAQFLPAVQMYLECIREDGIFLKWKKENNLSIDHFPFSLLSACSPLLLRSHFVTLQLIFTPRCLSGWKKSRQSVWSRHLGHCSLLKMNPIWVRERKLAGVQMRHLSSPVHELCSHPTWTHLQSAGEEKSGWFGQLLATFRRSHSEGKVQRLVG